MSDFFVRTIGENQMLTSRQIMEVFKISESTLRSWEKRGKIAAEKINGLKYYRVSEVEVLYDSLKNREKPRRTEWRDSFYWSYEDPEFGRKIHTLEDYYKEFPYMEKTLKEVEEHKYSLDKLANYEFGGIRRPDSPTAMHKIIFKAKSDHPLAVKEGFEIMPLEFEVTFERMQIQPTGVDDFKNQAFFVSYVRTDPYFITPVGFKCGN